MARRRSRDFTVVATLAPREVEFRGNQSIYLHRSGPLLENDLDRPKNRYGRDMVFLVRQHCHVYRRDGWSQSLPLKISFLLSGWWW